MAKVSGIPSRLLVGAYDITTDIGSLGVNTEVAMIDVSSIADAAMSRIIGRADGSINLAGFWDVAVGQAHAVLSTMPTTDVNVQYLAPGATATLTAKQIDYAVSFNTDGSVTIAVNCLGNGSPVEWGVTL